MKSICLLIFVLIGVISVSAQVTITVPPPLTITGCGSFPTNYFPLGDITIQETNVTDFTTTGDFVLSLPPNFEFFPGLSISALGGTDFTVDNIGFNAAFNQLFFTIEVGPNSLTQNNRIIISGAQIRGINVPSSGNILRTGGTAIVLGDEVADGKNHGTINSSSGTVWTGNTSSDWNTAGNWCNNIVPTAITNVTIPGTGIINFPKLTAAGYVHDITLSTGASINLSNQTLTINGAFTGSTNAYFIGSTAAGLVINGNAGTLYFDPTNNTLKTLTVNSGADATLGNALTITGGTIIPVGTTNGTVTVNGTLTTGGFLTLQSNKYGDAVVGQSTGFPVINGDVAVERYIPARRAWRFLAIPTITSQTINAAWQEGQANQGFGSQEKNLVPGYGTEITYDNIYTHGFDFNTTYNPSLKVWDPNANDWAVNTATPYTNTTQINAYPAYCLFVRGSRAVDLSLATSATPDNTTLRTKGSLHYGNYTQTFTSAAGHVILVSNPYACPVDITKIIAANSSKVSNKFYVWDPGYAGNYGVGGLLTYSGSGNITVPAGSSYSGGLNAQSGQAFMFETISGPSTDISFSENDKVTTETNVFNRVNKKATPAVYANLMVPSGDSLLLADGVGTGFGKEFSASVDKDDVPKLANFDENMMLVRNGSTLAIELRPLPLLTDTLFYRLYLKQQPYALQIFSKDLPKDFPKAWLIDVYLHTKTELNLTDTTLYNFTPNTDTNSYRNRFMIVLKRTLKAIPVSVNKIISEANPYSINNAITDNANVQIYPNPVKKGEAVIFKFNNMPEGKYDLSVVNTAGKSVMEKRLVHAGGSNAFEVQTEASWPTGIYIAKITGKNDYHFNAKLVIGK